MSLALSTFIPEHLDGIQVPTSNEISMPRKIITRKHLEDQISFKERLQLRQKFEFSEIS